MSKRYDPAERLLGGFSSLDGTLEFFGRVNAILQPHFIVLDLGAGRGAWHYEDQVPFRRSLRDLKSKVTAVIGADVDEAVLTNPTTMRNVIIRDGRIPIADSSIDLIVCDYVLEHISDVEGFSNEISRVLRPGGYFCGRTPHTLNYVSLAARMVKNARHAGWLKRAQPGRKPEDVFPTVYRCNTLSRLRRLFPDWSHHSDLTPISHPVITRVLGC